MLNSFCKSVFVEEDSSNMPFFSTSKVGHTALSDISMTEQEILHDYDSFKKVRQQDQMKYPQLFRNLVQEIWPGL